MPKLMAKDITATWVDELMCWRVPLTRGQSMLVDTADVGWVMETRWKANCPKRGVYQAARNHPCGIIFAHREIAERMGLDMKFLIDHKNRDPLDNRRCNLREATRHQNAQNRSKTKSLATSQVKGVTFSRRMGKWKATIWLDGRNIHLGYFESEDEAAQAYQAKAQEEFGDFYCKG